MGCSLHQLPLWCSGLLVFKVLSPKLAVPFSLSIFPYLLFRGRQDLVQSTFPVLVLQQFLSPQSILSLESKSRCIEPVAFVRAELIVFKYIGVIPAAGKGSAAVKCQHGCIPCEGECSFPVVRALVFHYYFFNILTVLCSFDAKIGAIRAISGNYLQSGAACEPGAVPSQRSGLKPAFQEQTPAGGRVTCSSFVGTAGMAVRGAQHPPEGGWHPWVLGEGTA